jgi:Spy/CpxP family protein refolding chaperone
MKKLRIAMMAAAMALCVTSVAKAQDAGAQQAGGRRGGGRGMQALLNGITLTDAQKAQFDSINTAYSTKNADLMTAARGGDADARTKLGANRQQQQKDVEAILTADQKTVFEKNVADMEAARQGGGRPPVAL